MPVGEYCLKHIDLEAAGRLLDFLNLMGYDFVGGWTDVCGHQAQLKLPSTDMSQINPTLRKSCSRGVDFVLSKGFPSRKILLGVPAYARYFPEARGPGQPFSNAGEMDYDEMPDIWVNDACVDESVGAASYVDSTGGKGFASFDVPASVAIKARYVKDRQLGGLFYWTGTADRSGDESLVAAGLRELKR